MPKRILLLLLALGVIGSFVWKDSPDSYTIYAQSVPVTRTFAWDANPASDGVTSYTARLDAGAPITVTPPATSTPMTFTTVGAHTITLTATNLWSTSPVTTLTVNVVVPGAPTGARIQ